MKQHELHPMAGRYLVGLSTMAALPLMSEMPWWIAPLFFILLGWRLYIDHKGFPLPHWILRWSISLAIAGGIWFEFKSFAGVESATAFLIILCALKLLEAVKTRDVFVMIFINWLLAANLQLFDQSTTALILAIVTVLTGAIILRILFEPPQQSDSLFKAARAMTRLFILGLPVGLLIFVVFPRFSVKTFGLGVKPGAETGFSDNLDPGSITQLAQTQDIVMRVTFVGKETPPFATLYWRGAVLDQSDGLRWTRSGEPNRRRAPTDTGGLEQIITLEPQNGPWLFGLENITSAQWISGEQGRTILFGSGRVISPDRTPPQRVLYKVFSERKIEKEIITKRERILYTLVENSDRWPRTKEFAKSLKNLTADEISEKILDLYSKDFNYTIQPGAIPENSLDYFLFQHKKGFCEHFAAAQATIFRLTGVPARVVVGFHGGSLNEWGGYLAVKGRDAHSWVEYYSEQNGWTRVDPVQAVAPERITLGAEQFFSKPENAYEEGGMLVGLRGSWISKTWFKLVRRIEALDFAVSQFLLEFDMTTQRRWFSKIGVQNMWIALIVSILLGVAFLYWRLLRTSQTRDPMIDLLGEARGRLAKGGFATHDWEGPTSILDRMRLSDQSLAEKWENWLMTWQISRYSSKSENSTKSLKKQLRSLR